MKLKAFLLVFIGACLAGTSGVFIKLMSTLDASAISCMRMGVPSLLLFFWLKFQGVKLFRGPYKKMILASLLNALRMYLYFVAFKFTSIGNAVVLIYTWPIFVAILGLFFLKEKFDWRQWLFLLLSFTGLILVYSGKEFSFEDKDFVGMLAGVASAFIYAFTVIIYKSESNYYSRSEMIFYQNLLGGFIFLPFLIFGIPDASIVHLSTCFFYAILIGLIVFNLFFYGLKYLKASVASSIMYMEVVGAIILSYLFFGDGLSSEMYLGAMFILTGSFSMSVFSK